MKICLFLNSSRVASVTILTIDVHRHMLMINAPTNETYEDAHACILKDLILCECLIFKHEIVIETR